MTALTLRENGFSSSGSVVCTRQARCTRREHRTHLPTAKRVVRRKVKDIHHQLRDGVAADPEEYRLTVLDQVQTVPLETLRRQWLRRGHNDASLADSAALCETFQYDVACIWF